MTSRIQKTQPRRVNVWLHIALLPMLISALVAYLTSTLWTIGLSFTASRMFPNSRFVGWAQYERLFDNERWSLALNNLMIYAIGAIVLCTLLGFLLAVFIDQKIRGESLFRTVFLYPYAMSMVVTGLVWQWILNPEQGIQAFMHSVGFTEFNFNWIVSQEMVMGCIILAAVWQGSGFIMALILAALRGVDAEIWKAASIDGIPVWRTYISVVLPMIKGTVITALTLQIIGSIKVYDMVIAMTRGGPGLASEVPAKFILDNIGLRSNLGQASAAATVLLVTVVALVVPYYFYLKHQKAKTGGQH
ncbi:MAG: sugar ABC transporter permease [Burkholderiales bacterium]|nr:MAG: sugar ABC transporter permease [Betaproteobacteria bacterium]TAG78860.1 MAG: sugar ABC transporter permease [Burkholderiales bacterium]